MRDLPPIRDAFIERVHHELKRQRQELGTGLHAIMQSILDLAYREVHRQANTVSLHFDARGIYAHLGMPMEITPQLGHAVATVLYELFDGTPESPRFRKPLPLKEIYEDLHARRAVEAAGNAFLCKEHRIPTHGTPYLLDAGNLDVLADRLSGPDRVVGSLARQDAARLEDGQKQENSATPPL